MLDYVRLRALHEGDILGRTLYDAKGMVLIKSGMKITANIIRALTAQGFKGVYIEHSGNMSRELVQLQEPLIDDYTTIKVINLLHSIFNNKKLFDNVWDSNFTNDRKQLEQYVDEFYTLFSKLNLKNELIFEMDDGRTNENWLEFHSFNVMQIVMAICIRLGCPPQMTKELGLAGLFHDIGKMKYPELVNKKDLTAEEVAKLREHPRIAFDLLGKLTGPISSPHCTYGCWQSHELYDGSGYPVGIGGQKVTQFGYIVGIASRFDNAIHCTPFQDNPMNNNDALEMIMGSDQYPAEIVRALCEVVSAYPIGTKVKLSNNEIGTILGNNVGLPLRPNVLIGFHTVNLAKDDTYRNVTILYPLMDV